MYPSRKIFSKTRLNAQKETKNREKVGVFGWQLGFPTASETRPFFDLLVRLNAFSAKNACKRIRTRQKLIVFFICGNRNHDHNHGS